MDIAIKILAALTAALVTIGRFIYAEHRTTGAILQGLSLITAIVDVILYVRQHRKKHKSTIENGQQLPEPPSDRSISPRESQIHPGTPKQLPPMPTTKARPRQTESDPPNPDEIVILKAFRRHGGSCDTYQLEDYLAFQCATENKEPLDRVMLDFILHALHERDFIDIHYSTIDPESYSLTQKGRAFLVKENIH